MFMKIFILFIFCAFTIEVSFTQDIQFDHLDIESGLPDNSVKKIMQDQEGYIWFATINGLSRYDGNYFKNYHSNLGLSSSWIIEIKQDKKGYIWYLTYNGTIHVLNPGKDEIIDLQPEIEDGGIPFKNFIIDSHNTIWAWGNEGAVQISYKANLHEFQYSIPNSEQLPVGTIINFIYEDNASNIWIGSNKGLVRYAYDSEAKQDFTIYFKNLDFRCCYDNGADEVWFGTKEEGVRAFNKLNEKFIDCNPINSSLSYKTIYSLKTISSEIVLAGSHGVLYEINTKHNKVTQVKYPGLKEIIDFFVDLKGGVWVAATNRGVYKYLNNHKKLKYYDLNAESREFLGDIDKQLFLEDSNGSIWIGIAGGGLFHYNNGEDRFYNYKFTENNNQSISSDVILSVYEDNSKNLWIGTMYGGVNKVSLNEEPVTWHSPMKNPRNSFENEVRASFYDKRGYLWIGSKVGRIYCYDKNFKLKCSLPQDLNPKQKQFLSNINVYALYLDENDNLWIATKGKGIYVLKNVYQKNLQLIEISHFNPLKYPSLDNVYSIIQDKHKQYWFGSFRNGLSLVTDPFTNFQLKVFKNTLKKGDIINNRVRYLFADNSSNLWIGTSDGISLLPEQKLLDPQNSFISISNDPINKSSLRFNNIDYIYEASDRKIYVATIGGGIYRLDSFDLANNTFSWKYFDVSKGLTSNTIYAIQEDEEHNLWLSSSYGLSKFNIQNESVEKFYVGKAYRLNYFTESCASKLYDGELLFGHRKGFITFNPRDIKKDTTIFPLKLSRIFINGAELTPQTSSLIDVSIDCLNEITLSHKQNSVRLEFSVLDYYQPEKIKYTYLMEGIDEKWSSPLPNNQANYRDLPAGNYVFRLKATNSNGYQMPQELEFRIHITPPFFKTIYGYAVIILVLSLLVTTFLIMYRKKISAQHEILYTEKINNKKLEYYTNISHEFKTPLSLIIGPAQDLLDSYRGDKENSEPAYYANKILNNARYLLNLIEQILDFRKINEEKMRLQVDSRNINALLQGIVDEFSPLAKKNNINFYFDPNNLEVIGFVDEKIITKVTYNLLSNAFKFTPVGKAIILNMNLSESTGMLTIKFTDEGTGISVDDQEMLFERFGKSNSSTGLGLFYVKELVNMHKGSINVESELYVGTTFTVSIPIQKSSYAENELSKLHWEDEAKAMDFGVTNIISEAPELNKKDFQNSILIIEDNTEMQEYLHRKFSNSYKVYLASNGKKGTEIASKVLPDLIICDVMMPVMDGIEATRVLRKNFNTCHIPIILLTANSNEKKKLDALEQGADDYINKPFDFKMLQLKINNILNIRKKLIQSFINEPELPANVLTKSDQDKEFIEKVRSIIESQLGKVQISVDDLSRDMGCSRTIFYQKMKGITGSTPIAFITTIQMKKAALLLKTTNYSLLDISSMVGYNDRAYFGATFKKYFSMTPKEYQKKHRGGN